MPYDPDCETDSEVYVNDHRLPAGDVDIFMRKEGPLDFTRYVEGTFASPFKGEDFTRHFDGLDEDEQDNWDTLTVRVKPEADNTAVLPELVFHGLVTGIGNSAGPEKEWHFRAQGPGLFLNKIGASKHAHNDSIEGILQYVANQLSNRFPFTVSTQVGGEYADSTIARAKLNTTKSFQRNKHTLADVLNWLRDKVGGRIWLEPNQSGALLFATDNPTYPTHRASNLDGNVPIVNNNALVELNPINTLILKGQAKKSIASIGDFEINTPSAQYWTVKVRHQRLYERAGGREYLAEPDTLSDGESQTEVANEAKSLLKEQIDEATGGNMATVLAPQIEPFHVIEAKPTCDSSPASDVPPVSYEASRVHHMIRGGEMSKTKLNVGIHTNLQTDLYVAEAWQEDK